MEDELQVRVPLLLAALAASVPWIVATVAVRIWRRPTTPDPGPETMDLRPEPPAVANLLVNGFQVTPDAIPATLLDLAASGLVEIEQAGPGAYVCRLVRRMSRMGLTAYEVQVLHLLDSRAQRGVVPAGALTIGPTDQAAKWWKTFRKSVVADARFKGLSRNLWDARTILVLEVLAILPAPLYAFAFHHFAAGLAYAVGAIALLGVIAQEGRQRDTPAGREAAAAWLGVKRHLETDPSFPILPPTAVAVWERLLAYGAALGVAGGAVRAIPMGAEDDHRAWSSQGGTWRQVRIRYPRLWPPAWGLEPWRAILAGLLGLGITVFLVWFSRQIDPEDRFAGLPDPVDTGLRTAALVILWIAILVALWSLAALLPGLADLGAGREVTGQVLRLRTFKQGENKQPLHYVAIDDGNTDVIRAWRVMPSVFLEAGVDQYRDATAVVTRYLRHVVSLGPGRDR